MCCETARAEIASSQVENEETMCCEIARRARIASSPVEKEEKTMCCETARTAEIARVSQFRGRN